MATVDNIDWRASLLLAAYESGTGAVIVSPLEFSLFDSSQGGLGEMKVSTEVLILE